MGKTFSESRHLRYGWRTFVSIISGAKLPQSKPLPAIFLQTAAGLGLLREICLVIEGTTHGAKTALTAGMRDVGLETSELLSEISMSDIVINNHLELKKAIALQED